MNTRRLRWFSAGAASAVATKLDVAEHGPGHVYYIDTGSEHPDNVRFRADVADWLGCEVEVHKSDRYRDVNQVIDERRYMNGPAGALCTVELKKKIRFRLEDPNDTQVFGYTADRSDTARANRFRGQNPDVDLCTPLIERGLTKQDCLGIIGEAGITIPAMYLLGYQNNNCIGCVKGGMGYWNKIRVDFPEVFERRSRQEREIGHTILRDGQTAVYLDELDPDRGRMSDTDMDCGLLCQTTSIELERTSDEHP